MTEENRELQLWPYRHAIFCNGEVYREDPIGERPYLFAIGIRRLVRYGEPVEVWITLTAERDSRTLKFTNELVKKVNELAQKMVTAQDAENVLNYIEEKVVDFYKERIKKIHRDMIQATIIPGDWLLHLFAY